MATGDYIQVEELKATLEISGQTFADNDVQRAVTAASRIVDNITDRRFYADADATHVRYYTSQSATSCDIDDLSTLGAVDVDYGGQGVFSTTLTQNRDYVLEPLNATELGVPWQRIRITQLGFQLPTFVRAVRVTGQFGWTSVPEDIKAATGLVASRLLKRSREAPFGVVAIGMDGSAVRVAQSDPDVCALLDGYMKLNIL